MHLQYMGEVKYVEVEFGYDEWVTTNFSCACICTIVHDMKFMWIHKNLCSMPIWVSTAATTTTVNEKEKHEEVYWPQLTVSLTLFSHSLCSSLALLGSHELIRFRLQIGKCNSKFYIFVSFLCTPMDFYVTLCEYSL